MQPWILALAAVAGVLLTLLWVADLRRDLDRRGSRNADWETDSGDGAIPSVWTSTARCPECLASGAVISRESDGLWHTCMACGRRHRRQLNG